MAWTTPVVEGDDLFSLAAGAPLRCLVDEINLKLADYLAHIGGSSDPLWNPIIINPGDDATSLYLWNNFTGFGPGGPGTGPPATTQAIDWLLFEDNHIGGFSGLVGAYRYPGTTGPFDELDLWNFPVRNLLGLPDTYGYDLHGGLPGPVADPHANLFMRRKRYRRLAPIPFTFPPYGAQTVDDQANAATAGQGAYDQAGNQWLCISSGNWVRDESGSVDILDNTLAPPNCVVEWPFSFYNTSPVRAEGSYNSGQVQHGDILGPWVFEERRLLLSIMTTLL